MKNKVVVNKKRSNDPDFFVVGLQKSGSYWVTALLNSHPQIRCLPHLYGGQTGVEEGRIFDMLAGIKKDGRIAFKKSFSTHHNGYFKDLVPYLNRVGHLELLNMFRVKYSNYLQEQKEKNKIVGDKTTEYIFHLDMIDDFYPNVKKICIIRDPKDRIVSWHFHQIRKERKKTRKISNGFVKDYCINRIKKEYEKMLDYNGGIHCFTYEQLSKNPQIVVGGLLKYLKMNSNTSIINNMIEEASLENCRKKDELCKPKKNKKKGEQILESHYRKGITGDWKNYLNLEQTKIIKNVLSALERKVFKKYAVKK